MGFWKSLLSLGEREPPMYIEANRRFAFLNVDGLREKLRLEARGKARGEIDQPPPDATGLDEVEKEIVRLVEEGKARAVEQFWSDIKADNASLASIDIQNEIGTIKRRGREALAKFTVEASQGFGVLEVLKDDFVKKKDDLRRFMEDNGLTRSATIKTTGGKVLHIAFAAVFAVLEWILNGSLLGESQAGGLIAGGQLALFLALANVAPAWLVGVFLFRRTTHIKLGVRLWSYFGIGLWIIYVIGFNFFAGHIRDAIVASVDGGNPETMVLQAIKESPLTLNDYKSYLLLLLGIGASTGIALDACFYDDTYYGYGPVSRARNAALIAFHDTKKSIQDSLKDYLDTAMQEMESARKSAGHLVATHANALVRRQATSHQFRQYLDHLESVGRDLLSTYRTTNKTYRKAPPPATFLQEYVLERGDIADPGEPPTMPPARVQELVSEAAQTIDEASAALTEEFTKQAKAYARIEDII